MSHTPPEYIGTTKVEVLNDPLTVNGEEWVTLMPADDPEDERLWEFSLTTGRALLVDDS